VVKRCFEVLDHDRSGVIDSNDLKGIFNAKEHPDVIAKRKTEAQVLKDFLNQFESTKGNSDGKVS